MQINESISVIIPTYNRASDLLIAIQSVLSQTYAVLEILVCDDGSTDGSKDLVQALNNPRVKWIDCGTNGGPAIPRNIGIKNSKGTWIAFLDSDDEWLPTKVEKQLLAANSTNCKAVSSNAFRIRKNQEKLTYLEFSERTISFTNLLKTNYVICSSMMVHRSIFNKVDGFPEQAKFIAIEDYCLWLKLAVLTNIAFVEEPLVNYLDNPSESIRANDKHVLKQRKLVFNELIKWINASNIDNKKQYLGLVKYELNCSVRDFTKKMSVKIKNILKYLLGK